MGLVDTRVLLSREPKPGWHGRFFDSAGMSFAYYDLDAGASLHEHSHPNEEVWHVVTGELDLTIGAERFRVRPGQAAIVPSNTAHSVRAEVQSSVIVVDAPRRGEIGGGARAAFAIELERFTAPAVELEVCNRGRASGILRRIEIESGFAPVLPPPRRTEIPGGELPERIEIPGGARHCTTHEPPPLTPARREQIRAGSGVFYLRGVILYDDGDGDRHHTTFCRVLDDDDRLVPPDAPGYNYGD